MMYRQRGKLIRLTVALGLWLAGCGGEGDGAPPSTSSAPIAEVSGAEPVPATARSLASPEEIEELIEELANGQPLVVKTRIFTAGDFVESDAPLEVRRESGTYDPEAESLVVKGQLNGEAVVEDLRFVQFGERFFVLRDLYPDNPDLNLSLGRGAPVSLDDEVESLTAPVSLDDEVESLAASSVRAATSAATAPVITSIGGTTNEDAGITNGLVTMSCGSAYNRGRAVNDTPDAYSWIISGRNFGTTPGSVKLAGRAVQIAPNGWSPTRIEIRPTVPYTWGPLTTTLTLSTSQGTLNSGVGIVPAVRTRIFGQCTHYVAVSRLNMGLQPSPTAYGGYSGITASYVPRRGDQVQFYQLTKPGNKHAAILTTVSGPTQNNGVKKWTLTISERNYDCRHSVRSYTTTFEVKNGQVLQYPKSSISGYSESRVYYR